MIVKKPAIALTSCNSLFSSCHSQSPFHISTSSTSYTRQRSKRQKRWYATVQDRTSDQERDGTQHVVDTWPEPAYPHKVPTPYQILDHKRGQAYSKTRFTQLVKQYHPDRCDHPLCKHLSDHLRLERYRLIVAAHAILSDPSKRSAYDSYGAGWGAYENHVFRKDYGRNSSPPTHGPDSCMNNATWEDWEKWHRKYGPYAEDVPNEPQKPIYLSNTAFVSVVVMLAALGGIGQATRADSSSKTFMALRNSENEKAAMELNKVRAVATRWSREERIEMFLRTRDPDAYEDESLRKSLLAPDICDGGEATARNRDSDFRRRYSDTGSRQNPNAHNDTT